MARITEGPLSSGVSGRLGNAVIARMPGGGAVLRQRPRANGPRTASQAQVAGAWHKAMALFATLTLEEREAWADFCQELNGGAEAGLEVGTGRAPWRPSTLFPVLACACLRLRPSELPPRIPPAAVFLGDSPRLTVAAEPGGVRFSADKPNSPGVATALTLQRLRSVAERPRAGHDRLVAFHSFAEGGLSVTVAATPGLYVAGMRFMEEASGQASALLRLGRATVG